MAYNPTITAFTLNELTSAQKANLKEDDKALIEAGIMNAKFQLRDFGGEYVLQYLFEKNKVEIAKKVAQELTALKAEGKDQG
jgi:hypothetical protein